MLIFDSPTLLRQQTRLFRQQGLSIALVPTMGNLHDGHLKLVETARQQADIVVVTLLVNPLQFDRSDDLPRYPCTLQQDYEKLSQLDVKLAFSPPVSLIYPHGLENNTVVEVPQLSHWLEGFSHPGDFRRTSTILCKLFNLVQPDTACFGEKDYLQLHIVRQLVTDLNYDIDIVAVPAVRDNQGLALSSRNSRLTDQQRAVAPLLYQQLQQLATQLATTAKKINSSNIIHCQQRADSSDSAHCSDLIHINSLLQQTSEYLTAQGFHDVELHIRDAQSLMPLNPQSKQAVLLIAGTLGDTRLIDHCLLPINPEHQEKHNRAENTTSPVTNTQQEKTPPPISQVY